MTLTPADHKAIADLVLAQLLPVLTGQQYQPAAMSDDPVERIKRQALMLAKQGKRAESIELMKSLSTRRTSHA